MALAQLYQAYTGIRQGSQAKKMEKTLGELPKEFVSAGMGESVANARMMAADPRLAGQGLMEDKLANSTSQAIENVGNYATSGGDALAALTKVNANEVAGLNDIGIQAAGQTQGNRMNLQGQLGVLGARQDQIFQANVKEPWMQKAAAISALRQSQKENIHGAISGAEAEALKIASLVSPTSMLGGGAGAVAGGGGAATPAGGISTGISAGIPAGESIDEMMVRRNKTRRNQPNQPNQ